MAVVVTGASGFVGRSLCRALAGRGHAVRAVLRPGVPAPGPGIDRAEIDDLRNAAAWPRLLDGSSAVVHLAARAHQIDEMGPEAAKVAAEINSDLTRDFAAAARTAGAGRVVFLSSAGAQEAERRLAAGESLETLWLERPYQTSKLAAERALEPLERGGYAVTILRAPLVYGPDAPGNFRQLRRLMERGVPLPLGRVDNRRSFVFLGNLVDVLVRVVEVVPPLIGCFDVDDGAPVSSAEFARLTAAALGRKARLVSVPLPLLERGMRLLGRARSAESLLGDLVLDSAPLREALGWRPRWTLAEGLAESVRG